MGVVKNHQMVKDRYFLTYYSNHESLNGSRQKNKLSIHVADVSIKFCEKDESIVIIGLIYRIIGYLIKYIHLMRKRK